MAIVCALPFLSILDHSGMHWAHIGTFAGLLLMAFMYEEFFAGGALCFALSSCSPWPFLIFLFGASLHIVSTYIDDPHVEVRPYWKTLLKFVLRKPASAKGMNIWRAYAFCEMCALVACIYWL